MTDISIHSEDICCLSLELSKIVPNFACFWPLNFFGGNGLQILEPRLKLEFWGMSPPGVIELGGKIEGGEIPLVAMSHGPNSDALAYAELRVGKHEPHNR